MGARRDLVVRRADGHMLPVEIALKPVPTTSTTMILVAIVDVSSRKALEQQVLEANAELELRVSERTAELQRSNCEKEAALECLKHTQSELERLCRKDPLTGLANRREFNEREAIEQQRAQRHHTTLCLAMLDIDRFKRINDRHGHAFGDEVLRRISAILQHECRSEDLLARYGGEEFVLALPETSLAEAMTQCERLRSAIEAHPWNEIHPELRITISIGVVMRLSTESTRSALDRADKLLYEAKRLGRNRVANNMALEQFLHAGDAEER